MLNTFEKQAIIYLALRKIDKEGDKKKKRKTYENFTFILAKEGKTKSVF